MRLHKKTDGFTLIELLFVTVVVGVLLTLVLTTYSGVQAKNRNSTRQTRIEALQAQLETYYAQYTKYPTVANVNDASWRKANFKDFGSDGLQDPKWNDTNKNCTAKSVAIVTTKPTINCFTYQVTTSDGTNCDNAKNLCAQYTLTTMLEGGGKFVKSSLN
jgi:prepilin-type N-terminal cleavage/methylation domain-containing protein